MQTCSGCTGYTSRTPITNPIHQLILDLEQERAREVRRTCSALQSPGSTAAKGRGSREAAVGIDALGLKREKIRLPVISRAALIQVTRGTLPAHNLESEIG